MEIFNKLLIQVDLFFFRISLRFDGKNAHRTSLGVLCSISVMAIFLFSVYFFGRDMIEKKQPEINTIQKFDPNPDQILHNPDTFPIAFTLIDFNTWEPFVDQQIYQVSYQLQEQIINIDKFGNKSFNVTYQEYSAVLCDMDRDV